MEPAPSPSAEAAPERLARYWPLDENVTFLNHGSFGACPWPVLHAQSELRTRMEREPVLFLDVHLEESLDHARARLGEFLGADPDDLAFVPNATTGVNTVLRSLELQAGDEILVTGHDYNACINAIRAVTERVGARAVIAQVPFPVQSPDEVVAAILASASARTRLAVISHVTSPTALVFPIERIVSELASRGIDTLVDGAHTGMVPVNVANLGAAYYTGNAHKWLCAPKGSGFLHVRRDHQDRVRPLVISHGANSPRTDLSRFRLEFDWTGTIDPTPYLAIPAALDFFANLLPGGFWQAMEINRQRVLVARRKLLEVFPQPDPAPESMIGTMASIELPADLPPAPLDMPSGSTADSRWPLDPLHAHLLDAHSIEVPVYAWPHTPADSPRRRLLRISAQLYNHPAQYERLCSVLSDLSSRR
ncbi:MAG: aminotransferase class V-fold PLP-dependent enzyme [Chloroflexota bacterium]